MTQHTVLRGKGIVFIGVLLTSLNLRAAVTSLSAIFDVVGQSIPHFDISVIGMLPLIAFAIFGLLAPRLLHFFSYEWALFLSMVCVGVGLAIRLITPNFIGFSIATLVALAGMGFGNVLLPPLFKKYFPNQIGTITSIYSVMIAISAGLPSVISAQLVTATGWQFTLGIWSIIGFLAAAPWLIQCLLNRDVVALAASDTATSTKNVAYRSKLTWMIALLFGIGGMLPMYTMINWLPTYLVSVGFTAETAGTMLFVYNTLGIIHSFVVPLVLGKMKHPYSLVILAVTLQIVSFLGLLFIPHLAWGWIVIAGPSLLTVPAAFQLFNMRSRTSKGAADLSCIAQFIGYLLAAIGPFAFGWLHTLSGSYYLSFMFSILMSVLTLFFGYGAMRPGYVEDGGNNNVKK